MARRVPNVQVGVRILIICEGYEEHDYLSRLKSLNVWDDKFCIEIENAKSIDNIFAKYQYKYANSNNELILVFCDTEMKPYKQFEALKNKIDKMHGKKISNKIVFFSNPCTMQIILSHFEKVSLKTNSKSGNNKKIESLVGISGYRATDKQREQLFRNIDKNNYCVMKNNLENISADYKESPSTNVLELFINLEKYNKNWIKSLKNEIEN